jgi:beta-glucosidase
MMVTPGFYQGTLNSIRAGKLSVGLVEGAVRRLLNAKFKLGLFENPRHPDSAKAHERASSTYSRAQNQKLAEESLVLLKNDGILPLDRTKLTKIAIIGPNAYHPEQQNGDWAGGQPRENTITVLDGFKEAFTGTVEYQKGCGIENGETGDLPAAIAALKSSDAAVVVIGDRRPFYGEGKSLAPSSFLVASMSFLTPSLKPVSRFLCS